MRSVHAVILSLLLLSLSACALFPNRDPLNINVVGLEPLQSQDMEVRFAVKIRVQNPNENPVDYNGVALDLEVNGQPLASGVSDQSGSIARFSETVLTVPVSVSAFSVLRQTLGLSQTQSLNNLPYVLRGKLAGGLITVGVAGIRALIQASDRPDSEALIRSSLGNTFDKAWLKLVQNPTTGVMAGTLYMAGQIEGNLEASAAPPSVGSPDGDVDWNPTQSTSQQTDPQPPAGE